MSTTDVRPTRDEAERRAHYLVGLVWHVGAFVIVNAGFWLLDVWSGSGLNWAYYITVIWGFGLAFHALAYWVDGRNMERRAARRFEQR